MLPWGSRVDEERNCGESFWWGAGNAGKEALEGIAAFAGYDAVTGKFSMETAFEARVGLVAALGSLVLMTFPPSWLLGQLGVPVFKEASELVTNMGKGLIAWDTWAENPSEAAGRVLVNVGSMFIPGAGEVAAAIKALSAGSRIVNLAGDAASLADNVVVGINKVDGLDTNFTNLVGDAAGAGTKMDDLVSVGVKMPDSDVLHVGTKPDAAPPTSLADDSPSAPRPNADDGPPPATPHGNDGPSPTTPHTDGVPGNGGSGHGGDGTGDGHGGGDGIGAGYGPGGGHGSEGPPQPVGSYIDVAGEPLWLPERVSVDAEDMVRVDGGGAGIPLEQYVALRNSSVHNPDSDTLVLGRWSADDSSYIAYARRSGAEYFDMGYAWDIVQDRFGPTNSEMFQFFNKPVLDNAIRDGQTIRFSHDPEGPENSARMIRDEWDYLASKGYNLMEDGNGWIAFR